MLFAATSVIWGSSFLVIRVAVAHVPPPVVVFGRCVLGALILVPLAARSGALAGLRRNILPHLVVTCLDMALPTFLTVGRGSCQLFGGRDPGSRRARHRQRWPGLLAVLPAHRQAGAATAAVITYVMPVVALLLGVGLLGEGLTAGAIVGLIFIALGAWLTTRRVSRQVSERTRPAADTRR